MFLKSKNTDNLTIVKFLLLLSICLGRHQGTKCVENTTLMPALVDRA